MSAVFAPVPITQTPSASSMLPGWTHWLRNAVDPTWRPGEWDRDRLLFTADPDNPQSRAFRCSTAACSSVSATRKCSTCGIAFRKSGLTEAEFNAKYQPTGRVKVGFHNGTCTASGGRCRREKISTGLCRGHSGLWNEHRRQDPRLVLEEWAELQNSYAERPECHVAGCGHEEMSYGLCQHHRRKYGDSAAEAGSPPTAHLAKIWAAGKLPYLGSHQFSLANLTETVRLEFLFTLQQRDTQGRVLELDPVRFAAMQYTGWPSLALFTGDFTEHATSTAFGGARRDTRDALLRALKYELTQALWKHQGIDQTDRLQWDLRATGIRSNNSESGKIVRASTIDFGVIRQPWLRDAAMEWARTTRPTARALRDRVKGCEVASRTLSYRPGGGADQSALGFADMTAVFETCTQYRKDDGELHTPEGRRQLFSSFIEVIGFGRLAGLLDPLPATFSRHPKHHSIKKAIKDEEDSGKALPESVITQLDQHLDHIGTHYPYGSLGAEDVHLMFRTVYVLLRDTGRRPHEIAGARFECLERDDDEWQLIWDNRKARRLGRRLPIFQETVDEILTWRRRLTELGYPTGKGAYLFPPNRGKTHLPTPYIAKNFRAWADGIPEIRAEIPDTNGVLLPFDRSRIFPYALRHTYCQRHADAGVPPELLMELMDHDSMDVTRGYYKVSLKRRREAADTMRRHVLDRTGRAQAGGTALGYQRKSVAVPYGNCEEPTNVKAGGQACHMRFQCAGCSFYRPDPSYLPAIEDEVRRLKAGREIASMSGAAAYIIDGMDGEIGDYRNVISDLKNLLTTLPEEERLAIEEAAKVLRKARAGAGVSTPASRPTLPAGRSLLPVSVVRGQPTGDPQ
ncbi:tyrosine-type recombinase/integrase [Streptomyces sp. 5.8]|uniref:tyrosine-type recombinase/integrase n=1 Tax=Streptomyces sp. 5.8 TaxID=3406571 RepID=UPI003BB6A842